MLLKYSSNDFILSQQLKKTHWSINVSTFHPFPFLFLVSIKAHTSMFLFLINYKNKIIEERSFFLCKNGRQLNLRHLDTWDSLAGFRVQYDLAKEKKWFFIKKREEWFNIVVVYINLKPDGLAKWTWESKPIKVGMRENNKRACPSTSREFESSEAKHSKP